MLDQANISANYKIAFHRPTDPYISLKCLKMSCVFGVVRDVHVVQHSKMDASLFDLVLLLNTAHHLSILNWPNN